MQSTGADLKRAFFLIISPHLVKGDRTQVLRPQVTSVDFLF